MPGFDDTLDRATRRLRVDPELHLEVRRELAGHLEDAAADFRAGGDNDEQALAHAAKALGDPDVLAEQLWQANRRRVRIRFWLRWLARVSLVPAALLVLAWLTISNLTTVQQYTFVDPGAEPGDMLFSQMLEKRLKWQMSDEAQLIFFGDETANSHAERWRAVRDRWSDEPLYQLQYITALLTEHGEAINDGDAYAIERLLAELARGRSIDPHNGWYDWIEAAVHFQQVGELVEDESRSVNIPYRDGAVRETHPRVFASEVDEQALTAGVAAVQRATAKPFISDRSVEILRHRVEQLPPARSVRGYVFRIQHGISTLLPALGRYRTAARTICAEALRQADRGRGDAANALLDDLHAVTQKLAADSQVAITLLVAQSLVTLEQHTRALVWQAVGDAERAEAAMRELHAGVDQYHDIWHIGEDAVGRDRLQRAGHMMHTLMPAIPDYDVDIEPWRKAEYTLLDRAAMTWAALVLVFLSLACSLGAAGAWAGRWKRGEPRPVLLWMGWRRLGVVLAAGVLGPVALYAGYAVSPWGMRAYGLNWVPGMVLLYPLVAMAMVGLLWVSGTAMLRRRAAEIGMVVPAKRTWWHAGMLGVCPLLAVVPVGVMVAASMGWRGPLGEVEVLGWVMAIVVLVCGPMMLDIVWLSGGERFGRRAWRGGLWGVAAGLAVLALGVVAVWAMAAHPDDQVTFAGAMTILALVIGMTVALLVVLQRSGAAGDSGARRFSDSAMRSMGPVLAGAALVLAVTVGPALQWRERVLVGRIAAQSPIWIDLEVEQSAARELRAMLAGDEPAPPRR